VAYGEAEPQQALVLVANLAKVEAGGVEGRADLQLHRGLLGLGVAPRVEPLAQRTEGRLGRVRVRVRVRG